MAEDTEKKKGFEGGMGEEKKEIGKRETGVERPEKLPKTGEQGEVKEGEAEAKE